MMASTKSSSMKSAFGNNKQVKQVKRVAFSEMSQIVCVQRKTDQELKEVWYSREETNEFRSNAVIYSRRLLVAWPKVAQAYIAKSIEVDMEQGFGGCFHGIEHVCGIEHTLSEAVTAMILTTRSATINQVITEQERQRRLGHCNPERIAEVSSSSSLFSRAWRHRIAVMNSDE